MDGVTAQGDGAAVVDISVLPFTHELRAQVLGQSRILRDSFDASGASAKSFDLPELIAMMDAAGVEKALIPAQMAREWEVSYEAVAEMAAAYPGRIHGQAGIDPRDIAGGLRKLEHGIGELGFVGAHSYPHWFDIAPDDRLFYPFYAKCVELDVPVQIQTGKVWQRGLRNVARPASIDRIAVDFPDLKLVCIHTGQPWERELVSVASKHEHVYIGLDAVAPKDWAPELVLFAGDGERRAMHGGREKVLFGTNYPALDFADAIAGVRDLGFDQPTTDAILGRNASRIYRL